MYLSQCVSVHHYNHIFQGKTGLLRMKLSCLDMTLCDVSLLHLSGILSLPVCKICPLCLKPAQDFPI